MSSFEPLDLWKSKYIGPDYSARASRNMELTVLLECAKSFVAAFASAKLKNELEHATEVAFHYFALRLKSELKARLAEAEP